MNVETEERRTNDGQGRNSNKRFVGNLSTDDIDELESIADIHAEGYETKVAVWEEDLERCQKLASAGYLENCGMKPLGEEFPGETGIGFSLTDKGESLLLNYYSDKHGDKTESGDEIKRIEATGGGYEGREGLVVERNPVNDHIIIYGWYDGASGLEVQIDMPWGEFVEKLSFSNPKLEHRATSE